MTDPTPAGAESPSPNAFHHRGFVFYWLARFMAAFGLQIVSVAIGWHLYDATHDPFLLGLVGLAQFAPALLLVLVTGATADRFNRRAIIAVSIVFECLCALAFVALTYGGGAPVLPIFATLVVLGTARAFLMPAAASLVANLVPREAFANAVALNSTSFQMAMIVGPVTGGLLYGLSHTLAFGSAAALFAIAAVLSFMIPKPPQKTERAADLDSLLAGFRYIRNERIVLGAITLDLFAVILGGATALLPVFARDVLDVGPWGLGLLRSAPGIGAIAMGIYLARNPIRNHAGLIMFVSVAIFGMMAVVFGASKLAWLSIAALVVLGAVDMISVNIRATLIQLWTPDELRGRVSAVNAVFIGASNELGEFRAGTMAAWIGAVPAVIIGGLGTIGVAGACAYLFPELLRIRNLQGRNAGAMEPALGEQGRPGPEPGTEALAGPPRAQR